MTYTTKTRLFAVLTAILVVCSFVAAPVAAAGDSDRSFEWDGLSDSDSSDDGDTSSEEDETEESDSDEESDADEDSDDTDDSTDSGDGTESDTSGDSDDESTIETVEDTTDTVETTVDDTTDTVDETVETTVDDTTDTVDETVETTVDDTTDTIDDTVTTISLETTLYSTSDRTITEMSLATETEGVTDSTSDAAVRTTTSEDSFSFSSADGGEADNDNEPLAISTSGGQPLPAGPASASAAGIGLVVAAAALRGTPLLAGFGAPKLGALGAGVSSLLGALRPFLFPLRYSRYDDSDPLEHDAREEVYEIVNESPGAYLSEVSDEADLPLSTTRHHIKVLEREDLVSGAKLRGKRRFYPAYAEGIELAAALNDDSTATIIDAIARIGAASVSDLADDLDRDPSTISHHLQRLEEDDIIKREREGRAVMNKLTAEARTALEPDTTPKPGRAGSAVAGGAD